MTKVFLSGSRAITRVAPDVVVRLERIVAQRLPVIVGDAGGADEALQAFFHTTRYPLVEVFCTGRTCRNNVWAWPTRSIVAPAGARGFAFYAAKDRAMADEATVGLMLWDGASAGTVMNVLRLLRRGKKSVVYIDPKAEFVDIKTEADWERFLAACPPNLRRKLEGEAATEHEALHSEGASSA